MPEVPSIRRRWYQFGLGTMFVLVTLFAVWLGWQINVVRERQAVRVFIEEQGGIARSLQDWRPMRYPPGYVGPRQGAIPPKISLPFWRHWMGDEPVAEILWPAGSPESKMEYAAAVFPEAARILFMPPGIVPATYTPNK
ncbi:MAG TPA: hypothetical protein VGG64_09690 [Pirellulales bacterium]|jgi:hypothetical protein